jgi:hypothetical protein
MLNEPQDVFAPIAQVHDVPDVMDRNLLGENSASSRSPIRFNPLLKDVSGGPYPPSRIWIVLLTSGRPPAM